jgi:hypothetical protein
MRSLCTKTPGHASEETPYGGSSIVLLHHVTNLAILQSFFFSNTHG